MPAPRGPAKGRRHRHLWVPTRAHRDHHRLCVILGGRTQVVRRLGSYFQAAPACSTRHGSINTRGPALGCEGLGHVLIVMA